MSGTDLPYVREAHHETDHGEREGDGVDVLLGSIINTTVGHRTHRERGSVEGELMACDEEGQIKMRGSLLRWQEELARNKELHDENVQYRGRIRLVLDTMKGLRDADRIHVGLIRMALMEKHHGK